MEKKPRGWMFWAGWALTAAPSFLLAGSGVMKIMRGPMVLENMVGKWGYPDAVVVAIGVVEILCVALFVAPPTAVLGAVLIAGYLGGAVATHIRVGEPLIPPIMLGVLAWGGLFLRDERVRSLLPLRKAPAPAPASSAGP